MKKKKAAILARISRPSQSLESQIQDLRVYAQNNGYEVPDEFIFSEQITGINAGFKSSLTKLLSALDDARNKIEAILIWEITRLNRGSYDFAIELAQLNSKNVPVYFFDVDMWTWDFEKNQLSTSNCDKLIGASSYGRLEWEKIAKRTKRGRDNVAEQNLYVGHLADGYKAVALPNSKHKCIKIDENREQVIKNIYDLFISGKSTSEIADELNNDGIPTTNKYRANSPHLFGYKATARRNDKTGIAYERSLALWSRTLVSRILQCEWYKGIRKYNGKTYSVDIIIEPQRWEKAKEIREERAINYRAEKISKIHNYLLGGLIFCGCCGKKMYGHYTGRNNHYYCSSLEEGNNCGAQGVCKENVEAIVVNILKFRATNDTTEKEGISNFFKFDEEKKKEIIKENKKIDEEIKIKEGEIKKTRQRENNINDAIEQLGFKIEYKKRLEDIEKERDELYIDIRQLQHRKKNNEITLKTANLDGNIINKIWESNDLPMLRKFILYAIKRIDIYRADASIAVIHITYNNGKIDQAIYSHRLLRYRYILLYGNMLDYLNYDFKSNMIVGRSDYYFGFNFKWNCIELENEIDKINLPYEDVSFVKEMPVRKFLLNCRSTEQNIIAFDPSLYIEADERREEQERKQKEFQKKYNNGLPTTLPRVILDENYENYMKERKHLYNRRYKIKNHKKLSEEEKCNALSDIDNQLSLLKAKVKYLPREEQVKQFLKNGKK